MKRHSPGSFGVWPTYWPGAEIHNRKPFHVPAMSTPTVSRRDPVPFILGAVVLVIALLTVSYALYLEFWRVPPRAGPTQEQLSRDLEIAKKRCVTGPPQGPWCKEAARLTTEAMKRKME